MTLRAFVAGALAALGLMLAAPAIADQGSLCMPTSGVISGLTFAQDVNAGFQAVATSHSGASVPTNACVGTPVGGQVWLDQSVSPAMFRLYTGSNWLALGAADNALTMWQPPVGGGSSTLASASTTDLWSVAPAYVTVTGTTTISKLAGSSDAVVGTKKTVVFSGILTLTYSGTQLITPTAANITTAVGDTMDVVALGSGNVRIVNYTRASGAPLFNPSFTGDSGSGGVSGVVPAPAAGDAALNKVVGAGGGFSGVGVPVGASFPCSCISAPGHYLLEYGQAVSRATYSDLWGVMHVSATFAVTVASPAVFTWTGHGRAAGDPISLVTTGSLPTGLAAGTTYYVLAAGLTANTFEVSTSVGGSPVNTSGTQSGTHTATYAPYGFGDYLTTFNIPDMRGRVVAALDTEGGTAASRLTTSSGSVGSMNGAILGNGGGQSDHTQTIGELVPHTMPIVRSSNTGANTSGYFGQAGAPGGSGDTTGSTGGGNPANVVQPTLVMNYIIRY